jgi:hypothetical protein
MPTSQFTIYQSGDPGAPQLYGISGSLVNVLNKILVTGYGTKLPAGWTADLTSSTIFSGSTFRSASGSRLYLSVEDGNIGAAAGGDARVRCFETMSGVWNSGSGQFPSVAQGISATGGALNVRKSGTANAIIRPWFCAADAYTMYFFAQSEGTATYYCLWFGDFYSLKGSSDAYRCMINAKANENTTVGDSSDFQQFLGGAGAGKFIARTYGGSGGSITCGMNGMLQFMPASNTSQLSNGVTASPNPPNNSAYMSPLWINESSPACRRGKYRGLYQVVANPANYGDGQQFSGSNEYAGKMFQVIRTGPNVGFWVLEISNTVDTN